MIFWSDNLRSVVCNENSLVSIVIACYNHSDFVQECIKSIINQDYKNIELIIIDDGSEDNSVDMIREVIPLCQERFVRFEFRYRSNKGLCATLNEAIEWCSGIYLSLFASDDIMFSDRISKQIATFNEKVKIKSNLVAIYSGVEFIDNEGMSKGHKAGSGGFCDFNGVAFRTEFLPSPTFLVIREKILEVGGFNPNFKVEDFYMRLKLTSAGGVFYIMPEALVKYRRHDDNLSKKSSIIWGEVSKILLDYKDREDFNRILASSMMVQAHDLQVESKLNGLIFALKACRTHFGVVFSKSMFKLLVKLLYKPKV